MTLFSCLVSPLAMSSCFWVAVATLALLTISILVMSSSFCARGDPGDASHLALARVYLVLEGLDPPAEVDNPPPGGIRVAVLWWVVGVPRGSSRRASAGSARSRGSSPARGSTWWAFSRGS